MANDERAAGSRPAALRAWGRGPRGAGRSTLRFLLALAAAQIGFGLFVPGNAEAVPPEAATDADSDCPPFEATPDAGSQGFVLAREGAGVAEPGLAPEPADTAAAPGASGQIVTLPRATDPAGAAPRAGGAGGEAILALPKGASRDFDLGPGARVVESYWSPVLCATLARVTGPAGASPRELVTNAPATAALVPNDVYGTAASEVELVPIETPEPRPDPYRRLQWGLTQSGVEQARSVSRGEGVVVAVLDSAPQLDHRDLGTLRVAPVEGGPDPGVPGAHGTLMTGVIKAIEDNGFGIAGVAPAVSLVAVPVCTPRGATASDACPLFTVLRGVDAAWTAEAAIVNLSIVGPDNALLRRSMDRLDELGVLVVSAAGNEGTDDPRFPAAYPSVIGVGALDRDGRRFARSNRGVSAELLAPGVEILSTVPGDAFAFASGTSFAASQVSGSLAVLLGAGLDAQSARQALFQTAASAPGHPGQAPSLPRACDVLARAGRPCP